ncbi:hypothetical protein H2201_002881 [Coniosporium apollinis]|uniref:Protein kinase domain-containing protein n=1 Tax=Coniosporium apollinis TaxID=61459 RepID=A0ABQ9NZA4_9PEZI|nr:hypothetical protein H2201_002881 [Coniosporium apollinis]
MNRIVLNKEATKLPIFLDTGPKGTHLPDKPASTNSPGEDPETRAAWKGRLRETTVYAWRRKAGTNVERAAHLAKARRFMGHRPGSNTYREFCDQGLYDFNVVEVVLEGTDGRGSTALELELSEAIHRAQLMKESMDHHTITQGLTERHADIVAAVEEGDTGRLEQVRKRIVEQHLEQVWRKERSSQCHVHNLKPGNLIVGGSSGIS